MEELARGEHFDQSQGQAKVRAYIHDTVSRKQNP